MQFYRHLGEKKGQLLLQLPEKVQCSRHQEGIWHLIVSVHAIFGLFNLTLLPRLAPIISAEVTSDKKSSSPSVEHTLTRAVCQNERE